MAVAMPVARADQDWVRVLFSSPDAYYAPSTDAIPSVGLESVPEQDMILIGQIAPGWRVIRPLLVAVERDESGVFVVSDDVTSVYGEGPTQSEAYADYVASLIDYYEMLERDASRHPPTKKLFAYISAYVGRG